MLNNQQIFETWLEGAINDDECARQLATDSHWYQRFLTAQSIRRDACAPKFATMPNLDTSTMFRQQWGQQKPSRGWQHLWPKLSVGMSALALIISISPLQLQVQSGALALTWHAQQNDQQLQTMLVSFQLEQQKYLQQQLAVAQQQQSSQLIMLKDYLSENEQKARRSDMVELVEYLNQQRQADWQYWQDNVQPSQARLNYIPASQPNLSRN
jgi:hypothetical protein